MPNMIWSRLTPLQLGRYGEYWAKMEFASYGFDIYTSEVDDHGVDFVARDPVAGIYYEVQVKSARGNAYVYAQKSKLPLKENGLLCYLRFVDGALPQVYVLPSMVWQCPNDLFVSRDYGGAGQTSRPEWGINISQKNLPRLAPYAAEMFFSKLDAERQKES